MSEQVVESEGSATGKLEVKGAVDRPGFWGWSELRKIDERWQVDDVSRIDPQRQGRAVKLAGILSASGCRDEAKYISLHAGRDDFHASIPLGPIADSALLIYELDGQPLAVAKGGPLRFLIPDSAACHVAEIDECANVKFVDCLELSARRGYDNRPQDDAQHEALHRAQEQQSTDRGSDG